MASLNRVMLIGNLGADPEKRYTPAGQAVVTFNIATSERWKDKSNGQQQERTEWHRIVVWGAQAETCAEYLSKGRQVFIEGRLQTRQWEDKDGNKRSTTETIAQKVLFMGSAQAGGKQSNNYANKEQTGPTSEEPVIDSGAMDDVPF